MSQRRLLALSLSLAVTLLQACSPECVDQADCAPKQRAGERLTCDMGRCVTRTLTFGIGGMTGAGGGSGGSGGSAGGGVGGATPVPGTEFDGGRFVAQLTGTQAIPPTALGQVGSGEFALVVRIDGGVSLSWTITHGLDAGAITDGTLTFGGLAGQTGLDSRPLATSFVSPIVGQTFLNFAQAQLVVTGRTYVSLTGVPTVRGQLIPFGTRLATAALTQTDGGAKVGVIEFSVGRTVSYAADWAPLGPSDAFVRQGTTRLVTLTTNAAGAQGTFIDDGGILSVGRNILVQPRDGGAEATGELVFH